MTDLLSTIKFDHEGFMTDKSQWSTEIAVEIARLECIDPLTDSHWKIIDFCRSIGTKTGKSPTMREITEGTGLTTKELFTLFPKGPAKKVAKISGLGKPEGCI